MDKVVGIKRAVPVAPLRRRLMCILVHEHPAPAAMRAVSARGATLDTASRPEIGSLVELRHPRGGAISGHVRAHGRDSISVDFEQGPRAVAFALAAIAAEIPDAA